MNVSTAVLYNIRVMYYEDYGITVSSSSNISINNANMAHVGTGIASLNTSDINISSTNIYNSSKLGNILIETRYSVIANVTIVQSGLYGLAIHSLHHVTVTNTSVTQSSQSGINVFNSTYIAFLNISVMYSGTKESVGKMQMVLDGSVVYCGLLLNNVGSALLHNVQVMYSEATGICVYESFNIAVKNTTVTHSRDGIHLSESSSIYVSFTAVNNFSEYGINAVQIQHSVISNVCTVFTQFEVIAIIMSFSHNVRIDSIFLVPNSQVGAYEQEVQCSTRRE